MIRAMPRAVPLDPPIGESVEIQHQSLRRAHQLGEGRCPTSFQPLETSVIVSLIARFHQRNKFGRVYVS